MRAWGRAQVPGTSQRTAAPPAAASRRPPTTDGPTPVYSWTSEVGSFHLPFTTTTLTVAQTECIWRLIPPAVTPGKALTASSGTQLSHAHGPFSPFLSPHLGRMALARRPAPAVYRAHYSDFIQSFLEKEGEKKKQSEQKRVLSAAERAAHRETLDKVQSLQPHLAENTQHNIAGALRRWKAWVSPSRPWLEA